MNFFTSQVAGWYLQAVVFIQVQNTAWPLGYNELDSVIEIKKTGPMIGAKSKFKTNLQKIFFLSFSMRVWVQSGQKVLIWPKQNWFQKMQNFMLLSNLDKKVSKKFTKKVITKTNLTIMSESEKVHFSVTLLLYGNMSITFFNGSKSA